MYKEYLSGTVVALYSTLVRRRFCSSHVGPRGLLKSSCWVPTPIFVWKMKTTNPPMLMFSLYKKIFAFFLPAKHGKRCDHAGYEGGRGGKEGI